MAEISSPNMDLNSDISKTLVDSNNCISLNNSVKADSEAESVSPVDIYKPPLKRRDSGYLENNIENVLAWRSKDNKETKSCPPKRPELYKTILCKNQLSTGVCQFGAKCNYAHSNDELRNMYARESAEHVANHINLNGKIKTDSELPDIYNLENFTPETLKHSRDTSLILKSGQSPIKITITIEVLPEDRAPISE